MKVKTPLILWLVMLSLWQINVSAQSSPFVNCQQNRSFALGANGTVTINFSQLSAGSGASAGETVVIRDIFPSVFDCDDVGLQTVALTIQDTSGQNAICTTTVFITDGQDPVLTCPDDITINTDPLIPANVTYDAPTVSDCTIGIDVPGNINQSFTFLGFYTDPDGDVRGYYLSDQPVAASNAFAQSFNVAFGLGSDLATVIDQDHNDWLRESINFVTGTTNIEALIGYNDDGLEGFFLWFAGPENSGYENWSTGQPNNQGNEDFTVILPDGTWNDIGDAVQRRYIMQLEPAATPVVRQTAGLPSGSDFPVGTTTNTFEVTDAFGNTSTCSFDVTVVENPFETEVTLQNGTLSITDIENVSNDNISLSSDGTNLTISDLIIPTVSGGPTVIDATTVTVPLASITNGIVFNADGGDDTIRFVGDLTLTGVDNDIVLNDISSYSQSGVINIDSDFIIAGSPGDGISLNSITARSLSITGVDSIIDAGGTQMNISGPTTLQTIQNINLNSGGVNSNQFNGLITIEATNIVFFATSNLTLGTITATGTNDTTRNVFITDGSITLTGPVTTAGNSNLAFRSGLLIEQTSTGTITTNRLELEGNFLGNNTVAILDVANNDVNQLEANSPSRPLVGFTFRDINTLELGQITVEDFIVEAETFLLSENTLITKTGSSLSSFDGNIQVTTADPANPAIINHEAGAINFTGSDISFTDAFQYITTAGTTGISSSNLVTFNTTPDLVDTFGTLNVSGDVIVESTIATIDQANFSNTNAVLSGSGEFTGGPVTVVGTINPGTNSTNGQLTTSNLEITGGTFSPNINSNTDFDSVNVVGTVTLNNATLTPIGGFTAQPSDEIIIINNDGADAIIGTFNNLPEGSSITFGDFTGVISYTGGDGNDVALLLALETIVELTNGTLTITDSNGGISDDQIIVSDDGTTLTISNLVNPVMVSGGAVLADATTVTIPLVNITSGIAFNAEDGNDTITISNDLTLSGTTNSLSVFEVDNFTQNGALIIGGDIRIEGTNSANINLRAITAGSLTIDGFIDINDNGGQINISGPTTLVASDTIFFDQGQNNHEFGDEVSLEAGTLLFGAGATTTFGDITTTSTFDSGIVVFPGNIILNGDISAMGQGANFSISSVTEINQTGGSISTDVLTLIGNGAGIATLNQGNTIRSLGTVNPFVASESAYASLSLTNTRSLFLGAINVGEFTFVASTINIDAETLLTKTGPGVSTFTGDVFSDFNELGTINHEGGTIVFDGNTGISEINYIGQSGTTTRFIGGDALINTSTITFGTLESETTFIALFQDIDILDTSTFMGNDGRLVGRDATFNGPVTITNGGSIAPGGTSSIGFLVTEDLTIASGTLEAGIDGATTDLHDQIFVTGTVNLTDAILNLIGGFTVQSGDEVIIVNNDGTDAIVGTFNNLPEGAAVSFGDFTGVISYVGGDGNDIVLLSEPETTVNLASGVLTITDSNGGTSDDNVILSNDGTTLTISGLTAPVQVSTGVSLVNGTTVSLPLADITNDFLFNSEDGNDTLTINDPIIINDPNGSFVATSIDDFIQNGALTIGGAIFLEGTDSNLILGEITASSLNLRSFNNVEDSAGRLNISSLIMREISGIVNIANGTQNQSNHSFSNIVDIVASRVANLTAGTDLNVTISTTATSGLNTIVSSGAITLDGTNTTAGDSNLTLIAATTIYQPSDASLITNELTVTAGTTAIFLSESNDIRRLRSTNPLELISFIDVNFFGLGTITTSEFAFTAPSIGIGTETLLTKTGSGVSTFTGDVVSDSIEQGTINHEDGTIVFDGDTRMPQDIYNGQTGTITRFIGSGVSTTGNGFTFGTLESETTFDTSNQTIDILDTSIFTGANGRLEGRATLNGPVNITNGGVIAPGGAFVGFLVTDNLNISSGTFEANVEGITTDLRDQIFVNGTVNLTDAALSLVGGFTVQPGDEIIIINNDGTDAIVGIFNGLPEGSGINFGSFSGVISYVGNDGNDVVLLADTEDPVAVCQDITLSVGVNGLTVTGDQLDGGSTDNSGVVTFLINGQPSIDFTLVDVGDTEVTITAVDPSGNSAECTATITLMSNVNATLPILISEYQPSTTDDPQSIEIIGEPGESFVGSFVVIEGDTDTANVGVVLSADSFSGTFDANGLLTTTIPNITGPTHTVVLTSAFTGAVGVTDIDTDDDGVADDLSAFDTIFDAVGVGDGGICCPLDFLYGTDFGGVDLPNIGDVPAAIFRDGSTGDFFQISNTFGDIFDITGTEVDASIFDTTPTVDGTFGTINPPSTTFVLISPSVYLQGATLGSSNTFMRDDLRVAGLLPTVSPYGDGLTATFPDGEPNNTIVDWILVELRDATDPTVIVASQSGLLQRDGDIDNADGASILRFDVSSGNYFVAIKHRNHLGIMSANAIALSSTPTAVDFSDGSTATFGTNAQTTIGMPSGILGMWSGDVDEDGNVSFTNDGNSILFEVLFDPSNTTNSSLFTGANGYFNGDLELNSNVSFQADLNTLLFNVLFHPENTSGSSLFTFNEQLPQSTTTSIQDEDIILNRRAYIEKKLKEVQRQIQKR